MCFARGAVNRDPKQFADPDRFQVTRGATDGIAFGKGLVTGTGVFLAHWEGRLALPAHPERLPVPKLEAAEPRSRTKTWLSEVCAD